MVNSQFEVVMVCGAADGQKNTRKTITAAGKHNPAKSRLASFPSSVLSASGAESRFSVRF